VNTVTEPRAPLGLAPHAARELRSIDRLVALFQRRQLPWELWSHRTHLVVGLHYVLRYGFEEGLKRLRVRIRQYNEEIGIVNDATSGYHETATAFMMWSLAQFRRRNARVRSRYVLLRRLWSDPVSEPALLCRNYSPERLRSAMARRQWVEPDLVRLPLDARRRIYAATARRPAGIPKREPVPA